MQRHCSLRNNPYCIFLPVAERHSASVAFDPLLSNSSLSLAFGAEHQGARTDNEISFQNWCAVVRFFAVPGDGSVAHLRYLQPPLTWSRLQLHPISHNQRYSFSDYAILAPFIFNRTFKQPESSQTPHPTEVRFVRFLCCSSVDCSMDICRSRQPPAVSGFREHGLMQTFALHRSRAGVIP